MRPQVLLKVGVFLFEGWKVGEHEEEGCRGLTYVLGAVVGWLVMPRVARGFLLMSLAFGQ